MREKGPMSFAVALGVNAVGLVLINAHPLWRPWTGGLVTEAFSRTVAVASFAALVQIVGNLALLRIPPIRPWGVPVADAVFTAVGLLSLWVFLDVYPLDLGAIGFPGWDPTMQTVLGIAVFGVAVALVIQLLKAVSAVLAVITPPAQAAAAHAHPEEHHHRPTPLRPPPAKSRHR